MNNIGDKERKTQNSIVKFFQKELHYRYLGNWEEDRVNSNIEEEILSECLKKAGYSESLINKAIHKLKTEAELLEKELYDVNKAVYSLLRYGVKIKEGAGEQHETVHLINWKEPEKNDFAIAEEVTVQGRNNKRPDIVIYINGIAVGVIELKRCTVSASNGIRQNIDNQKKEFISWFFTTVQLVMAGNEAEGVRYSTIDTPEKYFLTWKEKSKGKNLLENHIRQLCSKERLTEIIHNFVVFDRGQKKLCRHNQYFGVKAAQESLKKREGGIIWHTQGSGKSLTMVWLAKWIKEFNPKARLLILTDREELDEQIEKVFNGVEEKIYRTTSCKDLLEKLNETTPWLMCSLIHKFGSRDEEKKLDKDYEEFLSELNKLPKDFKAKGDIHIFVDECHRTQSGKLHKAMKKILPHSIIVGFTGTPLMKEDKTTSVKIFGDYIHTYKFDEAVGDKVILDLRYEARDIDQKITSPDKIDKWFESKTRELTEVAKERLKARWGTLKRVLSSKSRLEKIVNDILLDMETKERLKSGRGNALLVSGSIYQACLYYELFLKAGFDRCAIVTSFAPEAASIKGEDTGEGFTDRLKEHEIYQKMLMGKAVEEFEKEAKRKFIEEPAQMKLLIVVDKLLTGFDAPPATYLYIDKKMQDHGLFQAICRVNRLDGEDKEYGYIVDYKDLFKSLESAVHDFTAEAFGGYDKKDVEGLLNGRVQMGKERLETALETVRALVEPVARPKDISAYMDYFCGTTSQEAEALNETESKRNALYKHANELVRAYADIAGDLLDIGYTAQEIEKIRSEVKHFEEIKEAMELSSGDKIDLKKYEPDMRHLIDSYVDSEDSRTIGMFENLTIVDLLVSKGEAGIKELPNNIKENKDAMAETIENNMRRVIKKEAPSNPQFYKKMSEKLDELIRLRNEEARAYEEYLKKIIDLAKEVKTKGDKGGRPYAIKTTAQRALYDNLDNNAELALELNEEILANKMDDFKGNPIKEKSLKLKIKEVVARYGMTDDEKLEELFKIVKEQEEY